MYIGSADWMDRNLSRRVEVVFPIEQPELKQRVINEILQVSLADNVKARELQADGSYRRLRARDGEKTVRSQEAFMEQARANAARKDPALDAPVVQVATAKPIRRNTKGGKIAR